MKFRLALLLLVILAPAFSYAQGCLTVFSEDGDRFYLVLNGMKQNQDPQTNVRIDGLTNDYYSTKIVFEHPGKQAISKTIQVKDQNTGKFAEMTYKIKTAKDGSPKLRFFSAAPVPVNYNPPPDMYIMHYGQPAPAPGTIEQTTVTTTSGSNSGNGSITIGAGGVNMNVTAPSGTTTQTTTTTTYTKTATDYGDQGQATFPICDYPMSFQAYKAARESVMQASYEETKLSNAKAMLVSNCLSTDQVMDLCRRFNFEASKLDFAKYAYTKTTDRKNYFKVAEVFTYDASKKDLNDYIASMNK